MERYIRISSFVVWFSCSKLLQNHRGGGLAVGTKLCSPVYVGDPPLWEDFYCTKYFPACAAVLVLCEFLKERLAWMMLASVVNGRGQKEG